MSVPGGPVCGQRADALALGAAEWLGTAMVELDDPSLYSGMAGVVLALSEANQYFAEDRFAAAVERGADELTQMVEGLDNCSLYFGLAGAAVALRALDRNQAADRALQRIRDGFDG